MVSEIRLETGTSHYGFSLFSLRKCPIVILLALQFKLIIFHLPYSFYLVRKQKYSVNEAGGSRDWRGWTSCLTQSIQLAGKINWEGDQHFLRSLWVTVDHCKYLKCFEILSLGLMSYIICVNKYYILNLRRLFPNILIWTLKKQNILTISR
jgi:hypothetical protein